jgi:uncharacterized protein (DUF1501 family)
MNASRRLFLRHAGALSSIGCASAPLALNLAAIGSAAAAAASDYKAIVCVFLYGGNDAINMVLPTDATSFANYTAVRNQAPESIALLAPGTPKTGAGTSPAQLGGVLPITPSDSPSNPPAGRSYALHPTMAALQTMFDTDKTLAIVPNVGPLILPTTKAQLATSSHPRPASLYSHNDQQNTWQSFQPEGATLGWGGRMADMLAAQNAQPVFSAVSAAGNAVWLAGQTIRQYQVSSTARPTWPRRCSASSPARVAAMCSSAIWRRCPNARSMPRRCLVPRCCRRAMPSSARPRPAPTTRPPTRSSSTRTRMAAPASTAWRSSSRWWHA